MKLKESYVGSIAIGAIGCLYFALDIYGTKLEYILFGTITGPGMLLAESPIFWQKDEDCMLQRQQHSMLVLRLFQSFCQFFCW